MATKKAVDTTLLGHFKDKMDEAHTALLNRKVDKAEGKGLSANDFTDEYKQELDDLTWATEADIDALFS